MNVIRTRRVIHPDCLPSRIPVTQIAVAYLLMDRLNAPVWVHGFVLGVYALATLAIIVDNWNLIRENVPGFGRQWKAWK